MSRLSIVVPTIVALVLAACAAASPSATEKQRLSITIKPGATNTFVLWLSRGEARIRDVGTVVWSVDSERTLDREGASVKAWKGRGKLSGRRGELGVRVQVEWLDAGRGFEAGASIWKVTGGSGSYASLTGAGRGAGVWSPRGPLASRLDGFVQGG